MSLNPKKSDAPVIQWTRCSHEPTTERRQPPDLIYQLLTLLITNKRQLSSFIHKVSLNGRTTTSINKFTINP